VNCNDHKSNRIPAAPLDLAAVRAKLAGKT
jgi:hypothetical protein